MTLIELIQAIEAAAAAQPAVRMIVRQDARRLNDCPDAVYGVFSWVQGVHSRLVGSDSIVYQFSLFYIDRLTADRKNETFIQSTGIQVLNNVIDQLNDNGQVYGISEIQFTPFDYRFADECAGVFTNMRIEVAATSVCETDYTDLGYNDGIMII